MTTAQFGMVEELVEVQMSRINREEKLEKMAFVESNGRYCFMKEQEGGEYIVVYSVDPKFVTRNEEGKVYFNEKNARLVVYKPKDMFYDESRSLLIKHGLFTGGKKFK